MPTFFAPSAYVKPLTPEGRARTIAAFYLAQGEPSILSDAEMRRDVLTALMSKRAVGYWLNQQQWLELVRKVGRVQILRLTDEGLRTCSSSAAGGSATPTTPELIEANRRGMRDGGNGYTEKTFRDLPE